eukprot:jgi/Undpi1/10918/HiC_scaffold_3.g01444.m1
MVIPDLPKSRLAAYQVANTWQSALKQLVVAFAAATSSLQIVVLVGATSPMEAFHSYLPKGSIDQASVFQLEFDGAECTLDTLSFSADEDHWKVSYENCLPAPSLKFDGEEYELVQLHIHSPSEHMVGGSCHDAEIHFVHENPETSEILVVGIFLDIREYGSNVVLEPLWDVLNSGATETADTEPTNAYDLLPASKEYVHYDGSFTTPPCTEGVKWIVMTSPTVIGKMQLDEFRASISSFEDSKV